MRISLRKTVWHVSSPSVKNSQFYLTELVIYVGGFLSPPFQTKFVPLISRIPLLLGYEILHEKHVLVKLVATHWLTKVQ